MSVFTGLTDFDPVPSLQTSASVTVSTKADEGAPVIGYLVARDGDDPGEHEWDGVAFEAAGFEGHVGQTIALPSADGPLTVLVGVGELADLDADRLRDAGAAFARATERHRNLTLRLGEIGAVAPDVAGQVLVEGALLARYRYDVLKAKPTVEPIEALVLVVDGRRSAGVRRARPVGPSLPRRRTSPVTWPTPLRLFSPPWTWRTWRAGSERSVGSISRYSTRRH